MISTMDNLFDIKEKWALITGASRGLGKALAEGFASADSNLILLARDQIALEREASRLTQLYSVQTFVLPTDISSPEQIENSLKSLKEKSIEVDILVNNAGILKRSPFLEHSLEDWQAVFDTNVRGTFLISQIIAETMKLRNSGRIINIASILAVSGGLNVCSYASAKGATMQLTKAMSNELAPFNINVNSIAPGYFETDMTVPLQQNSVRKNALLARIPSGRFGKPHELVGPAIFLASRASSYVTGETIFVDGGWTGF